MSDSHTRLRGSRRGRWRRLWLILAGVLVVVGAIEYTPELPRDALEAKYAAPPSRFLVLPSGARVHYRDQGSGPVLVLLHGSLASLHTWEQWVSVLGSKFRVVTLDLPGHGLTGTVPGDDYSLDGMVTFFDEFRKKLGLTRFALAGNSMGGTVSWRFTLAHPDAVSALVLLDSGGVDHLLSPADQPKLPIGFKIMRLPVLNRIAQYVTPRRLVEKSLLGILEDPKQVTPALIDRTWDLLRYPGNRRAARLRNDAPPHVELADRLGEIRAPTLVLWGEKDKLRGLAAARIFVTRIPGSKLVSYPNVGHLPMEEIPERSATDALEFLKANG
jgi:pimeloyl-ACP methyl ester carboxylesterase